MLDKIDSLETAKLIAEAWDAGGLYQVGSFPSWNRWAEWNGKEYPFIAAKMVEVDGETITLEIDNRFVDECYNLTAINVDERKEDSC